uniref:Uncharacterized protein n=1 Tax=Lotharella oceanica TaxID=641309 RepID=A0A7S2U2E3_9EUKA|mmetsp:Transcript_6557/g.12987  ORF Transcript_6557/g.12987 Transcript_6557/m.12987 type:complete len:114 (+) Transcript_6557:50-391(+)
MSLSQLSRRVLAMGFWKKPRLREIHGVLSHRLSRPSFELSIQGSVGLFMISSIIAINAFRRYIDIKTQRKHDAMLKERLATDPRYAQFVANAQEGYLRRLAAGQAATLPKSKD